MLTVMMPTFVVPVVVEEIILLEEEDNLNLLVVEEMSNAPTIDFAGIRRPKRAEKYRFGGL
jgi:hypothetical protein